MAAIAAERYTGASIKRSEDPRILTGAGRYVDDIKLPGMLHAAFVRSPMAHARVLSVDAAAARALHGVGGVYWGAELVTMTGRCHGECTYAVGSGWSASYFSTIGD